MRLPFSSTKKREGKYLCYSVFSASPFAFTDSDALWSQAEAGTRVGWHPGDNYGQQPQRRQQRHRDLWATTLPLLQVQRSPSYLIYLNLKDVSNRRQETSPAAQIPHPSSDSSACNHVCSAMEKSILLCAPSVQLQLACFFWGGRTVFISLFWLVFDGLFPWPLVKFHCNSPWSHVLLLALRVHNLKDSFSCPYFRRGKKKENLTTPILSIKTPPC